MELRNDGAVDEESCIRQALELLEKRIRRGPCFDHLDAVKDFLRIRLARRDYEVFAVLWLDRQHHMIEFNELFRGTVSQTSVYPRELVREAIRLNASACIFSHNLPSGTCMPSHEDAALNRSLQAVLDLIEVRVLDHIIVTAGGTLSMAALGLM